MEALRIAICEDVDGDAAHLRSLIESSGIAAEVTRFADGGDFLASRPAGRFDLVFFDVYMADVSGVAAARALREADERCGVVFSTSSEEHRAEAFDVDALQYLVKPVDKDRLERVLKKRLALLGRKRDICTVNAKGLRMDIPHDNICYVEVYGHNCLVHTASGVIDTGSTMAIEDFAALLPPPRFMRCHRSYIVNLSHVESVGRDFAMKNGGKAYISRGLLPEARKYGAYLDRWRLGEAGRGGA